MRARALLTTGPRAALHPSSLSPFFLKLISKEWCAYLVFGIRVGAVGQEELHRRHMAVLRSVMEGRIAILRGGKEGDKARAMREHETRAPQHRRARPGVTSVGSGRGTHQQGLGYKLLCQQPG